MRNAVSIRNAVALALIFGGADPARAQSEPAADSGMLQEIIVTAQKRAQSAQDVGISMAAFSDDDVSKLGWAGSEDIAAQTPGLIATSFSGGGSTGLFSIRGISQNDFADHQEAPSAMYVDGVYQALTGSATAEMFDVDRVEVLRGPQGTLFGRNATGGLVHIVNKAPSEQFESYADLTVGEYGHMRVEGALSGPLTDRVRARLSFLSDKADGYFEHSGARLASIQDYVGGGFPAKAKVTDADDFRGIDSENVRAQIDFDLNDATTLGFTFNYGTVDNVGNAYDTVPSPDGVVDLSATDFWGSPFDPKKLSEAPNLRGFVDKKALSYTGDLNYEQDDWSLTAIVNYSTAKKSYLEDDDGGPNNIALFGTDQDADTFSAEIRANGESGRLTWTTGLYYLLIDGDYFGTFQFPGITGASGPTTVDGYGYGYDLDYGLKTEAFAAFAQAEYELSDQLRLILGARWTADRKDFDIDADCVNLPADTLACDDHVFVTPPGVLVSEPARTFLDLNDDFLTWKAQLEYQPVDDVLLYAGYNRGVKAGSFTAPLDGLQPVSALTFRPEVLDSFEVGTKADFLDRRLRLNLSAFYYDYKDYQGFVFSGITTVVKNFPATIYGGEVELTARPVDGLEARAGLSLLNARVKHVEVSPDVFAKQHMVLAPDVSANWLLRYEHPAGPGTMSVQYDGSYSGRQYYNTINGPLVSGKGYALMNARIGYAFSIDAKPIEVSLFVKNLTDERNQTYAFDLSAFFGNTIQVYGPPRMFGASVRVDF